MVFYFITIGVLIFLCIYLALKSNHHRYWHKHYKEKMDPQDNFFTKHEIAAIKKSINKKYRGIKFSNKQ